MSLLKDEQTKDKNLNGQIQSLKKKLSGLSQENENLKKKIPPRTNISMDANGSIVLSETINNNGRAYNYAQSVEFGKAYKAVRPLIEPLLQIARAAALGSDVYTNRQKAHEVDSQGKPTKELKRDEEGKQVWLPNHHDKAAAISRILMSDPECREALKTIEKKLIDCHEEIKDRASAMANMDLEEYNKEDEFEPEI